MSIASQHEAAAKAAFPELWPDNLRELSPDARAALAFSRQQALTRVGAAIAAYELAGDEEAHEEALGQATIGVAEDEGIALADFTIGLPEDAAMVLQVITTISYVDTEGRTVYVVRTMGEGQRTSWLGMCVLTQDYLLNWRAEPEEG